LVRACPFVPSNVRRSEGMTPRTKREYLRELVANKNRWSRPLTAEEHALGFLGWHEHDYLSICHRGHLSEARIALA
jgi:hypothetical protein